MIPRRLADQIQDCLQSAEIDLVLEFGSKDLWAIEIKRSPSASLGRGFHEACGDVNPSKKFVVHAEADAFPMKNDIQAISLYGFMSILDKKA